MHSWGDDWFEANGNDLDRAIFYCMRTWKKYGRIGSHGKEKFGTFRDHVYFFRGGLHDLIWPGYGYIQNRFIAFYLDEYFIGPFMIKTGLYKLVLWYQYQVYNYAIQKMCKKYPNIIDELVSDLEGYKVIKPGLFGNIDGTVIHNKYWKEI